MNILYYIPSLSKKDGGIYQYSAAILKNASLHSKNKYFVYHFEGSKEINDLATGHPECISIMPLQDLKEPFPNFVQRIFLKGWNKIFQILGFTHRFPEKSFIDHLITKYKIDIVHSPVQFVPLHLKVPAIVTIHDVQHLHLPQYFSHAELRKRRVQYKNAIDNANAIVVSYEHIKNDIHKFYGKPNDEIHVCLLDMQNLWHETFINKEIQLPTLNTPKEFILYPAATWEHKNHIKLIEAIYYLKQKKNIIINLLCPGHQTPFYEVIKKKIGELNLEQQVTFLGIVSDETLYSLYQQCKGVVVPTLYEAGSFPLMESIIMSVPVICSNVTSLPQTIGKTKFTFNPNNIEEIADRIYSLLYDADYRKENIENSKEQSEKIKFNNFAATINGLYKSILKSKYFTL